MDTVAIGVSAITLLFGLLFGAWFKVLVGRTFKSIDSAIASLQQSLLVASDQLISLEKCQIVVDQTLKGLESVKNYREDLVKFQEKFLETLSAFQRKSDYIREMDQVAVQLEATCNKIDGLDAKFEKLRDRVFEKNSQERP